MLATQIFVFGQVIKYRITNFSIKMENLDWIEWKECDMLLVMNLDHKRITIYTDEIQNLDIVKTSNSFQDSDGDTNFKLNCVDNKGKNCTVTYCICESLNGLNQLYIKWDNFTIAYNIRKLD
jgi:hypothetical protein